MGSISDPEIPILSNSRHYACSGYHYENTPIQIYGKFYHQKKKKNENFQIRKCDIFHISAQNIDYGYSLEPPCRGGSYEYQQSMF